MSASEPLVLEHLNRRMAERGSEALDRDSELLSSGLLDSLSLVELVSYCEKQFGISVPDDAFVPENFESPAIFAALIDRLRQ